VKTVIQFFAQKFYLLLGLVFLAVLFWLLYIIIVTFFKWFSNLENQIAASIITASFVALISTMGLILSKHYEHKREIRKELATRKIPVYEELINFSFRCTFAQKMGEEPPTEQETVQFIAKLIPRLIIWSDGNIIKSFCSFRDCSNDNIDTSNPKILFIFEDMLLKIRNDLGHKDKRLKRGDILGLYVNDINKYLTP